MNILKSIEEFKNSKEPLILTIGTFDGVHRGHGLLLKTMKELAGSEGQTVVITFKNHPSEVLRPTHPVPFLCTVPHRLKLLESFEVDTAILLPFDKYLAQHNASQFIEKIRQMIPFTHLVLGHDATLGRDKQGDRPRMLELSDLWGFTTLYIEEYRFEGKPVSSSRIREAVQIGDFIQVETLLNRPYTIYAPLKQKNNSLFLDVAGLCLPPSGRYSIETKLNQKRIEGTASINATQHTLEFNLEDNSITFDNPFLEIEIKALVFNHSNCHE